MPGGASSSLSCAAWTVAPRIRPPRPWTTTPETSSICSTRFMSRTRWLAACRWAVTWPSPCSATRRDTFARWCSPTRRSQADTPEGIEGRKRMLALIREQGAAGVAADMLPKLLGETTRREHPELIDSVRSLVLASSADALAGGDHGDDDARGFDRAPVVHSLSDADPRRRGGHPHAAGPERRDAARALPARSSPWGPAPAIFRASSVRTRLMRPSLGFSSIGCERS